MPDPVVLFGESTVLGYRAIVGGTTYTPVGNRVSIDGPNLTRDKVDTTIQANEAGTFYRTSRPSNMLTPGELKLKVYYNPLDTTHQFLLTQLVAPAATASKNWQVLFSDGSAWSSDGYVTGYTASKMDVTGTGNVEADVTITLTGELTITPFVDPG
ncbi:phage tail tube protein [Paludisphaera borealis]|uniref:Phage tail protein n=1 Tax=Paludisphaera borealis TaxID=1387353 RepID=A0A1U7CX96_9BACT|nr:phage tail tube protein [Paludisphaera borealis]APW63541.1 hypothetical protein BSF38_05113 [Paludisphaera borealis]